MLLSNYTGAGNRPAVVPHEESVSYNQRTGSSGNYVLNGQGRFYSAERLLKGYPNKPMYNVNARLTRFFVNDCLPLGTPQPFLKKITSEAGYQFRSPVF